MSFILNDKQLRDLLTSIGQKELTKFAAPPNAGVAETNMEAAGPEVRNLFQPKPVATPANPLFQANPAVYNLASKLLQDLQNKLSPAPGTLANVGSEMPDKAGVNFSIKNARNIGDFVNWAADSKLTWDNQRFAWRSTETGIPADALEFTSFTEFRDRDKVSNQLNTNAAYAMKESLIKFIMALRDSDANRKNQVMQVAIGSLIDQLNRAIPNSIKDRKPGAIVIQFDNNTLVDGLNSSILDYKNWSDGIDGAPNFTNQSKKITYGDISSQANFLNWLNNIQIKQDDGTAVSAISPTSDVCMVFHILYKRADWLSRNAARYEAVIPNYSKLIEQYKNIVVETGHKYQDKNGKPCPVTTLITGADGPIPDNKGAGGAGTAGGNAANLVTLKRILTEDRLPFTTNRIELPRYMQFLELVTQANLGVSAAHINLANQSIGVINNQPDTKGQKIIVANTQVFDVSGGYDRFKEYLNNAYYIPGMIPVFNSLLNSMDTILNEIQTRYITIIKEDAILVDLLQRQHSIFQNLLISLSQIKAAAEKIAKGQ